MEGFLVRAFLSNELKIKAIGFPGFGESSGIPVHGMAEAILIRKNMSKFATLQTLYAHELQEVYHLELQLAAAVAEMERAATDENLKKAFYDHGVETQQHLERLKEIFNDLGLEPSVGSWEIQRDRAEECREMAEEPGEPHVKDAALVAWAQRAEHEEIGAYGTLRTFARHLGHGKHAALLADTLEEEEAADKKLTRLAEGDWFRQGINREAAAIH